MLLSAIVTLLCALLIAVRIVTFTCWTRWLQFLCGAAAPRPWRFEIKVAAHMVRMPTDKCKTAIVLVKQLKGVFRFVDMRAGVVLCKYVCIAELVGYLFSTRACVCIPIACLRRGCYTLRFRFSDFGLSHPEPRPKPDSGPNGIRKFCRWAMLLPSGPMLAAKGAHELHPDSD